MKYLAVIRFADETLTSIIFDSIEQMNEYFENTYIPNIKDIILKIAFSTEKDSKYVDVL